MSIKKCIILAIFILLFSGCGIFDSNSEPADNENGMGIIFFDNLDKMNFPLDAANIDSISLQDHQLFLNIGYSGGCRDHIFRLYVWRNFLESNPPQAELYLSHDDREDDCEAYITEWLNFDLNELVVYARSQYGSPGSIVLKIYAPNSRQPYYPLPILNF